MGNSTQAYWEELFGHEFGHIVGFQNVTGPTGCTAFTVMHQSAWSGSLPGQTLCADEMAVAEVYAADTYSGDSGDEWRPSGEDFVGCWDYYIITTIYFEWTDGRVTQGPSYARYIFTHCEPREDGNAPTTEVDDGQ